MKKKLKEMGINNVQRKVEEGGIFMYQIFFHEPCGFMIEICNCENLPVVPLTDRRPSFGTNGKHTGCIIKKQQQCLSPALHMNEQDSHIPCAEGWDCR